MSVAVITAIAALVIVLRACIVPCHRLVVAAEGNHVLHLGPSASDDGKVRGGEDCGLGCLQRVADQLNGDLSKTCCVLVPDPDWFVVLVHVGVFALDRGGGA